jgi:uncharacterized protein
VPLSRVTVTLPPELVSAADDLADRRGASRSAVFADALQTYVRELNQVQPTNRVSEPAGAYMSALPDAALLSELSRRLGVVTQSETDAPPPGPNEPRIRFDRERLAAVCRLHHVHKLSLFGSVLTDAFGPGSDVDVIVQFEPGRTPGLAIIEVEDQLSAVFGGRRVDLVTERSLHPLIREEVLASAALQFAA